MRSTLFIDTLCDYNCRTQAPKAYITRDGHYAIHASSGIMIHAEQPHVDDGIGFGGSIAGLTCDDSDSDVSDPFGCPVTQIVIEQNLLLGI